MDPEQRKLLEKLMGAPSDDASKAMPAERQTARDLLNQAGENLDTSKASSMQTIMELRELAKKETGSPETDMEVLGRIREMKSLIGPDGNVPGAGQINNLFFDPEPAERGMLGNLNAAIQGTFSQDSNEFQVARGNVLAKQYQKAYESLKGGGQITVYEGRTVANALSTLGNSSLTDESIIKELDRIEKVLNHSTQRGALGIETDVIGREYQILPDGNRKQVITAIGNSGDIRVIDLQNEDAVMVPNGLTEDQRKAFVRALPKGQTYVVQNEDGSLAKGKK